MAASFLYLVTIYPVGQAFVVMRDAGFACSAPKLWESTNDDAIPDTDTNVVEKFLKDEYASFHSLLSANNPSIWTTLAQSGDVTIFAPTDQAFTDLGEKKLRQLRDVRNAEIVEKLALYHIVLDDAVSAARLRTEDWTSPPPVPGAPRPITVRGLVTMSGEVPVGREKEENSASGGLLSGMMMPQDGTGEVVIGPRAKIQKSVKLKGGTVVIHAMDSLVSPDILWRYCDQLQIRLPGI